MLALVVAKSFGMLVWLGPSGLCHHSVQDPVKQMDWEWIAQKGYQLVQRPCEADNSEWQPGSFI